MNPLLNAEAVSKILGTSRPTVYTLSKTGALRTVVFRTRPGKWTYRWREEDVRDFIKKSLREGRGGGR